MKFLHHLGHDTAHRQAVPHCLGSQRDTCEWFWFPNLSILRLSKFEHSLHIVPLTYVVNGHWSHRLPFNGRCHTPLIVVP